MILLTILAYYLQFNLTQSDAAVPSQSSNPQLAELLVVGVSTLICSVLEQSISCLVSTSLCHCPLFFTVSCLYL